MPTLEALAAAEWLIGDIQNRHSIREVRAHSEMDGHRDNGDFATNPTMRDWIQTFNDWR